MFGVANGVVGDGRAVLFHSIHQTIIPVSSSVRDGRLSSRSLPSAAPMGGTPRSPRRLETGTAVETKVKASEYADVLLVVLFASFHFRLDHRNFKLRFSSLHEHMVHEDRYRDFVDERTELGT